MFIIKTAVIRPIAHIENDYMTRDGIPRQSGMDNSMKSRIVFDPEYRIPEAFKGIEECSHIWLIWQFSENLEAGWAPEVHPGGIETSEKKGLFATRSPYRPNSLGLSCVELVRLEQDPEKGPVLVVRGADMMNGTPVFDVKPYVPFTDCRPEAGGSF